MPAPQPAQQDAPLQPARSPAQVLTSHAAAGQPRLALATLCWLGIRFLGRKGFNLETAVGRARVGRDGVRWQGATTLRAHAREEEQRRQRAPVRLSRVRSAVTQKVKVVVGAKARIHTVQPAERSGQLRFPGSRGWMAQGMGPGRPPKPGNQQ